jgi:hypothetical protein
MSNIMKVEHAVKFIAEINIDKVPARLLPTLLALNEDQIKEMCLGATVNAIEIANMLEIANENNSWAEVKLA